MDTSASKPGGFIQKGAIVSHERSAYRWPLSPTWKNFLLKLLKQKKPLKFSSSKSSSVSQALQDCKCHAQSAAVNVSQAFPKGCYKPVKSGRVHSDKKQVKGECKAERGEEDDMKAGKILWIKMLSPSAHSEQNISAVSRDRVMKILHIWWKTLRSQALLGCVAFDVLLIHHQETWTAAYSCDLFLHWEQCCPPSPPLKDSWNITESTWTSLPGKGNIRDAWFWELNCTGLQKKITVAI